MIRSVSSLWRSKEVHSMLYLPISLRINGSVGNTTTVAPAAKPSSITTILPCAIANGTSYRSFSDKKKAVAKAEDGPKIKQSKVKRKDKSKKDDESVKSREYNLIISALDAPMRKEPPITEEEKARRYEIGRNYTIGRFRFHNQVHQDLQQKIHLKKHAIKMLPRDSKIKEEALKDNEEAPPAWRRIPVWTPPITDFDPSLYAVKDEEK